MKKTYASPSLAVYGKLEGIGGSAPDVPPLSNVACVTGTATTTGGGTVTITCATQPSV